MKRAFSRMAKLVVDFTTLGLWITGSTLFAASTDTSVLKTKKEGKLRVLTSLQSRTFRAMIASFRKHYSFIEVSAEEITGPDSHQRFLLERKADRATDWDVFNMAPEFYPEYMPHIKKFDLLGMALQNVL